MQHNENTDNQEVPGQDQELQPSPQEPQQVAKDIQDGEAPLHGHVERGQDKSPTETKEVGEENEEGISAKDQLE